MVIVGYYAHGNKHYVAFNGDEEHPDRFMTTDVSAAQDHGTHC